MVAMRVETAAHQPDGRFSIMPVRNRKKKMCSELKVIVLGNAGVGKTRLLSSLTRTDTEKPTGLDFRVHMASVNSEIVKLQLWDTADQEKHGAAMLPKSYFRRARGVFLVYDASDRQSFRDVVRWTAQLQSFRDGREPLSLVVVANHTCSSLPAVVSATDGRALASLLDASFVEWTSSEDPRTCLDQLLVDLSSEKTWQLDVQDVSDAMEAISLAEKTQVVADASDSETESEFSTDSDLELEREAEPDEPTVSSMAKPAPRRRDSRFFVAMELGNKASVSAVQFMASRDLQRMALLGGCALLCACPMALLMLFQESDHIVALSGNGGFLDGAVGLVKALAWMTE